MMAVKAAALRMKAVWAEAVFRFNVDIGFTHGYRLLSVDIDSELGFRLLSMDIGSELGYRLQTWLSAPNMDVGSKL